MEQPNRYVAVTTIEQERQGVDVTKRPLAFAPSSSPPTDGFLLNGQRVPLNGVCDHHDLGALGSAINTRALQRQIGNSRRTWVATPSAPATIRPRRSCSTSATAWALWSWTRPSTAGKAAKSANDYALLFADWHEKDVRAYVRRDRNHPCVILWSIGNEISEQAHASTF